MKRRIGHIAGIILGLVPAFYNQTNARIVKIIDNSGNYNKI